MIDIKEVMEMLNKSTDLEEKLFLRQLDSLSDEDKQEAVRIANELLAIVVKRGKNGAIALVILSYFLLLGPSSGNNSDDNSNE